MAAEDVSEPAGRAQRTRLPPQEMSTSSAYGVQRGPKDDEERAIEIARKDLSESRKQVSATTVLLLRISRPC